MTMLTLREIEQLASSPTVPWVSVYLPTHRHAPGTKQDPIRYRGLVDRAAELLSKGHDEKTVRGLIEPLRALDSPEFWNYQLDGLAVLCSPAQQTFFRLTGPVPELAVVANSPHTKPLVQYVCGDQRHFVLALSKTEIALFEGSRHALDPVDLQDVPTSLAEAMQVRSRGHVDFRAVEKGWRPVFRAPGTGDEDRKHYLEEYFRRIDKAFREVLHGEEAPVVTAGVRYLQDIFHSVSKNPLLLDEGAEGNFDKSSPEEIHRVTWPIIEKHLQQDQARIIELYHSEAARGRGSDELQTIGHAVAHGRVRILLVAADAHVWGYIDRDTGNMETHDNQRDDRDTDILDELAEMTLLRGGKVLVLSTSDMPISAHCAAVFRF